MKKVLDGAKCDHLTSWALCFRLHRLLEQGQGNPRLRIPRLLSRFPYSQFVANVDFRIPSTSSYFCIEYPDPSLCPHFSNTDSSVAKMPGILPMKVIRVGNSSQSRIAQACDRCRSKKIRCDGNRPCCTQCANVGFECKTSDKLSRRAFPRGYTESLEDRVRSLETEVRELKLLLDEKDEKIDVLSRIRSFPSPVSKNRSLSSKSPAAKSSSPSTPVTSEESKSNLCAAEPLIRVQPLSSPSKSIRPETAFSNGSSTRAFTCKWSFLLSNSIVQVSFYFILAVGEPGD